MAKGVKINKVIGEAPLNLILFKSDEGKITKIEINNRKFSSEKMGRAFLASEFKMSDEEITALLSEQGEEVEVTANAKGSAKTGAKGTAKTGSNSKGTSNSPKKEVEPVYFTNAYKTEKTVLVVDGKEFVEGKKKIFSGKITDMVSKVVTEVESAQKAIDLFTGTYKISKAIAEKMVKKDSKVKLELAEYEELKSKIEAGTELEDAGILGAKPKADKKPKEPRKPIEGYPKWVLRDPQDVNQYTLMQEAKNSGYSAKIMESCRATNGAITVKFEDNMLWKVNVAVTDAYKATEEYKALEQRLAKLEAGNLTLNETLESSEKRYCIFLAKALAGTYKLAFDEKKDIAEVDKSVITSTKRRQTAYNR